MGFAFGRYVLGREPQAGIEIEGDLGVSERHHDPQSCPPKVFGWQGHLKRYFPCTVVFSL